MNNYHIYEEIGKGKYSQVYKGRKKKTIEYMAVKSLEKSRRTKLLNEVKMFSGLKHNNVLKFYHWYETRNHLWVILEYCPGGDLMSLIEADPKGVSEQIALKFVRDIANGLNYLHSKGIGNYLLDVVYCDLKPSNILFNEFGVAKLSDLGLARRLVDMINTTVEEHPEMTKRGSPYYMAPELFNEGVYSFQSDLWALGCIAYELLTGQPPYQTTSFQELVDMIINTDYKPVDGQLGQLINGLLDKDPRKRLTWDRICKILAIPLLPTPTQAHFESWLRKNSVKVDIVRLSLNVHKNMLREDTQKNNERDLRLVNKDQEIQIGQDQEEEEAPEEETPVVSDTSVQNTQKLQLKKQSKQSITQSPIPGGVTPQMKKTNEDQLVPIDQLIIHTFIRQCIKPIIGNREIEKSIETSFLREQLPFQYISPEDVSKGVDSDLIEQHFENIYNFLANNAVSQNDKLNILNYFEQIVQTSNVANRLLNSAFVPLVLKLLKVAKLSQLKHRLCCILGLLIRHATVIEVEVSQVGIIESMIELLSSKEQPVIRRKAAAALGEYLFYGATQMEDDPQNQYWEMPPHALVQMIRTLKEKDDEIVKFYIVKTIENISCQSVSTGSRFCESEILSLIWAVYCQSKNDQLRVSCAVSLANLVLIENSLVEQLIIVMGLKNIVAIFEESLQRVQQAVITIFNIYLLQSLNGDGGASVQQIASNAVNKMLLEESTLIKSLVHLLDHGSQVTRGKAAIALMLMVKFNISALLHLDEDHLRFYIVLEKGSRDTNDYLKQCLAHLVNQLSECTPLIIQIVSDSLTQDAEEQQVRKQMVGNQIYINVLLQYSQSPQLQPALFSPQYLGILSQLLQKSQKSPQVQTMLFTMMSKLCTSSKILIRAQSALLDVLKNSLTYMTQVSSTEVKFMFLKFVTELISALLQEDSIYDYPHFLKPHANDINAIIQNILTPILKNLFSDPNPLPVFALKLVSILLTYNIQFLNQFRKQKVIQVIIDMYSPESNQITSHTLNIVQKIIEGSPLDESIVEKSIQIFNTFVQSNQDWAYDELSNIMTAISSKVLLKVQPETTLVPVGFQGDAPELLLQTLQPTMTLLINGSHQTQSTLLLYLLNIIHLFPGRLSQQRAVIFNTLLSMNNATLQKRTVKVMHWLLALNEQKPIKVDKRAELNNLLEKVPKDNITILAVKEITRYL